ncbi:hypothetical protein CGZ75_16210 [Paenibacillus herberti]|uniref:Uncharacterized protein n=1 Tax=Paenibacillus herberti TaxID=1619309 RepID=A0A229NXI4_9BACL|nr:hypothetical protein CGZ75_16210 [Paenibacillus herberti]
MIEAAVPERGCSFFLSRWDNSSLTDEEKGAYCTRFLEIYCSRWVEEWLLAALSILIERIVAMEGRTYS